MTTIKRDGCAILPLVLTGKWYNMIARGGKREEYRLATGYWCRRLFNWDAASFTTDKAPVVEFRHGYAKDAPRMAYWCMGLGTSGGMKPYAYVDAAAAKTRHPEWGEPEEPHFLIRLGGRVNLT